MSEIPLQADVTHLFFLVFSLVMWQTQQGNPKSVQLQCPKWRHSLRAEKAAGFLHSYVCWFITHIIIQNHRVTIQQGYYSMRLP